MSNGVKQGGIISVVLFIDYMNDRSCAYTSPTFGGGGGGRIGSETVYHLSYADDLCLISL